MRTAVFGRLRREGVLFVKVDVTVRRETGYIGLWILILSALMEAVFLILGRWNLTVLSGNLLGGAAALANFFLMGLTIQKGLQKDEKQARQLAKLSQTLRMLMLFIAGMAGVLLNCFNTVAAIVPLFFPRIAISLRPLFDKKHNREDKRA